MIQKEQYNKAFSESNHEKKKRGKKKPGKKKDWD